MCSGNVCYQTGKEMEGKTEAMKCASKADLLLVARDSPQELSRGICSGVGTAALRAGTRQRTARPGLCLPHHGEMPGAALGDSGDAFG